MLEEKEKNTKLKDFFINQTYKKYQFNKESTNAKRKRLENVLRIAMKW